jgi:2-polyprenyl-3-methyl-5-hydroxy-6-metoxy-1,4-benzoquinol methylase
MKLFSDRRLLVPAPWPEDELEHVGACPACGQRHREILYEALIDATFGSPGIWTYWRCSNCGSAYPDPRPTLTAIGRAYSTYYTHTSESLETELSGLALLRRGLRNDYLNRVYGYDLRPARIGGSALVRVAPRLLRHGDRWIRRLPRPTGRGRLLDVGCGSGAFVRQMIELGWDAEGVDPDASAVNAAQDAGLPVRVGGLGSVMREDPGATYDAITLTHVVEHFHAPLDDLGFALTLLRPGGVLWIATPGLGALGHRLFGGSWRGLEPPRHLIVFTSSALETALRRVGFTMVEQHPTQPLARRMFRESSEIQQRATGHTLRAGARVLMRAAVPIADVLAGHWPTLGEEMVFTAVRE